MTFFSLSNGLMALCCLVFLTGPARATDVQSSDHPLCDWELRGLIMPEAVEAFERMRASLPEFGIGGDRILCLDSPGGNFESGLALFEAFWDAGVITAVPEGWRCHSACAIAFLGGGINTVQHGRLISRAVYPGGEVGFHAPSLGLRDRIGGVDVSLVNSAFATAVAATDAIVRVSMLEETGVSPMSGYVLRRILGTLPEDMYVLRTVEDFALSRIEPYPVPDPGPLTEDHIENICDLAVFRHRALEEQADLAEAGIGEALDAFRAARRAEFGPAEIERVTTDPMAAGLPGVTYVRGLVPGYAADDGLYRLTCAVVIEPFEERHATRRDARIQDALSIHASRVAEVVLYTHHMDFPIRSAEVPLGQAYEFNLPPGAEQATVLRIPVWFAFDPHSPVTELSTAPPALPEDQGGGHADRPRLASEVCAPVGRPGVPAAQLCGSSVLPPQGANSYGPDNLSDADPATAWVENAQGDGLGEAISWEFERPTDLQYLGLINGYAKTERTFTRNARVRRVVFTASTGVTQEMEFRDDAIWQDYRLEGMDGVRWLRMEILETYPGTHYADTAISEIRVN